MRHPTCNKPFH